MTDMCRVDQQWGRAGLPRLRPRQKAPNSAPRQRLMCRAANRPRWSVAVSTLTLFYFRTQPVFKVEVNKATFAMFQPSRDWWTTLTSVTWTASSSTWSWHQSSATGCFAWSWGTWSAPSCELSRNFLLFWRYLHIILGGVLHWSTNLSLLFLLYLTIYGFSWTDIPSLAAVWCVIGALYAPSTDCMVR